MSLQSIAQSIGVYFYKDIILNSENVQLKKKVLVQCAVVLNCIIKAQTR